MQKLISILENIFINSKYTKVQFLTDDGMLSKSGYIYKIDSNRVYLKQVNYTGLTYTYSILIKSIETIMRVPIGVM